jgi:hypothetical protein
MEVKKIEMNGWTTMDGQQENVESREIQSVSSCSQKQNFNSKRLALTQISSFIVDVHLIIVKSSVITQKKKWKKNE